MNTRHPEHTPRSVPSPIHDAPPPLFQRGFERQGIAKPTHGSRILTHGDAESQHHKTLEFDQPDAQKDPIIKEAESAAISGMLHSSVGR